MTPAGWFENDSSFIAAHYQPAALMDLALSRDIDQHRLLRGTRLFYEDVVRGHTHISPNQYLQLISNAHKLMAAQDTSFLLGQRLLPGHYGVASHALRHATHLQQALEQLLSNRALLSPLLAPRLFVDDHHAYLYWIDAIGCRELHPLLVETSMTAVTAMCRWLAQDVLPWRYHFSYTRPRHIEQYWVHLNEQVFFDQHIDVMILPKAHLFTPWPNAALTAGLVAQQECRYQREKLGFNASFLDRVYAYMQRNLREPLKLESVALAFEMSPATFKRKLQKHHTHFQAQWDLVRKHAALYLYQVKGFSNETVAESLRFQDTTNLRRAFKRWTGTSPSSLRGWYADSAK